MTAGGVWRQIKLMPPTRSIMWGGEPCASHRSGFNFKHLLPYLCVNHVGIWCIGMAGGDQCVGRCSAYVYGVPGGLYDAGLWC